MSKYKLIPYKKVGEISFGMSRDSVRKLLGQFKEFKKNRFSKNSTDDFKIFHVYYSQDNIVEAVELFVGVGVELEYKEKNLLDLSYNELIQFIKSNSFTYKEIDSRVVINDIGISVYAPNKTKIESILVYRKGYYDSLKDNKMKYKTGIISDNDGITVSVENGNPNDYSQEKDGNNIIISNESGDYAINIESLASLLEGEDLGKALEEKASEAWFEAPVYGVESVVLDPATAECYAHYSVEKFLGNKKDNDAPSAGKMRVQLLGFGTGVVFSDKSTAKNDVNSIFTSPYIKSKIKEFDDYYIGTKGYKRFTQEDAKTFKMDIPQFLRKIFSWNLINHIEIKFFDGTAIYGIFSHLFGKAMDKVLGGGEGAEGGLKGVIVPSMMNHGIPFCIAYTHENEKGEKKVIVRRFLVVGIFSSKITKGHAKWASGGKEIGTVKKE